MQHFCEGLDDIETGDLLVWSKASSGNSFWLNMVRFFTISNFGHVSVAEVDDHGSLWHVEAVMPRVRRVRVPVDADFYVIKMSRIITKKRDLSWFADKIGKLYSIMDAIRSYLGITVEDDDRWQCAELTAEFYKSMGLDITLKNLTPTKLVTYILEKYNLSLYKITKEDRV